MGKQITAGVRVLMVETSLNKVYKELTKLAEVDPRHYQIADILDLIQMAQRKTRRLVTNATQGPRDQTIPAVDSGLRPVRGDHNWDLVRLQRICRGDLPGDGI